MCLLLIYILNLKSKIVKPIKENQFDFPNTLQNDSINWISID